MSRAHRFRMIATVAITLVPAALPAIANATSDVTAPSIQITNPTEGAHHAQGAAVPVAYVCSDTESGVASCTAAGGLVNGGPLDTTAPGDRVFTVTAWDNSGNTATATVNYVVDAPVVPAPTTPLDTIAPAITITSPTDQQQIPWGTSIEAAYSCSDTGSTVTACAGPIAAGAKLDTKDLGTHTFAVTALDAAGNLATRTVSYTVIQSYTNPATNREQLDELYSDLFGIPTFAQPLWMPLGLQSFTPWTQQTIFLPLIVAPSGPPPLSAWLAPQGALVFANVHVVLAGNGSINITRAKGAAPKPVTIARKALRLQLKPRQLGTFDLRLTKAQIAQVKQAKGAKVEVVYTVKVGAKVTKKRVTYQLKVAKK